MRRIRFAWARRPWSTLAAAALVAAGAHAAPLAYVPNEGSASISVIDTARDTVVDTLKVGQRPRGIAVSRDGTRLYVSDQVANAVLVFDLVRKAEVGRVPVGDSPEAIYLSAAGKWLSAAV
jgi:YVTN family beta-propeller protein